MMMNQGGSSAGTVSQLDPNSLEKHQVVEAIGGSSSIYSSVNLGHPTLPTTTWSNAAPWTLQRLDNNSCENGVLPHSSFYHDQQTEPLSRDAQGGVSAASHAISPSTVVAANGTQQYATNAPYSSSTDPYGYSNKGYQGYYYGYQQQTNNSYPQQVGACQNSGAPYQPLTSFQNSGSYAGSTSYSSTYYNAGDYQTTGAYPSSSYGNQQTNWWNDGSHANYSSHQYPNYPSSDVNGVHGSGAVAGHAISYEQHNKQWENYYNQTTPDISCAPGTENITVTSASTPNCQIPGVTGGYTTSDSQPPPPGTTSWKQESKSSESPSLQVRVVTGDTRDGYWRHGGFRNQHVIQTPPYSQTTSFFQKPLDSNPVASNNPLDLQKNSHSQGPNLQFPTMYNATQNCQPSLQTSPSFDPRRVNKLQIPTNPRIANLAVGLPKLDKDGSATNAATKPAYIGVSVPKPDNKGPSDAAADSVTKQVMFPESLRAYVERALSRCKNDSQKAACQNIMKEMITKASADGTLFTRDWDTEPLFTLPDSDTVNKDLLSASIVSSLSKYKKSPSRRTKSRWEPVPEEKLAEKLVSVNHAEERDKMVPVGKNESKVNSWINSKAPQLTQTKNSHRPVKKQRFGDSFNVTEHGDASSESDKEQGLTAYTSAAVALANSPEERKRRENRFKRFEKGHAQRAEIKHFKPKAIGGGNLYSRRASALEISKSYEDGESRAVEDMDWDSLTLKGTCQEIEKRYLRLTSAPDPGTVRPEEVLEKALLTVQGSQKNYLYKCDQLKSIRQDLTVQRIHNELTVKVYETHARLALEAGDLPEYNQCQSQLKSLYAEGINGCHMEFSAYNLLCVILHSNNNRDLVSSMARLSDEAKRDEAVRHALAVRAAVTSGNYVSFFRLYKTAPNLNPCLMDLYVEKMRFNAVKCMSRSYRPAVPLAFIAQILGFTNSSSLAGGGKDKDSDGLEECEEWLRAHGAFLNVDNSGEMQLDTKASSSSLFMPEPDDAVAHGDTNLAVNDFLTRTT